MPKAKTVAEVKAELESVLASEIASRKFSYTRSDGSAWTLALKDVLDRAADLEIDRKSTRLNSSHSSISYAVFCLKKKKIKETNYKSEQITKCSEVGMHKACSEPERCSLADLRDCPVICSRKIDIMRCVHDIGSAS